MPRAARKKAPQYLYHVISRSISEVALFTEAADKDHYLTLLFRYKLKYGCRILAYCLMDTHVHFFIDPCGFDISKFMLSLNTSYVTYYNKKYKRRGHLFEGRFTSTVVESKASFLRLSAYIHNNPKDLPGYDGREDEYPYSSFGIYCGKASDRSGFVDTDPVLGMFENKEEYHKYVSAEKTGTAEARIMAEEAAAEANIYIDKKRMIIRDADAARISHLAQELTSVPAGVAIRTKNKRSCAGIRSFVAYALRVLGGYSYEKICGYIGNISVSGVCRLVNEGFRLVCNDSAYRLMYETLASS